MAVPSSARARLVAFLGVVGLLLTGATAEAQQSAPAAGAPAAQAAPDKPSTQTIPAAPSGPTKPDASPAASSPAPSAAPKDAAETETIDLAARPAAYIESKAAWDEGFAAINAALATVNTEIAKAGLKSVGRPIAVFTETDDKSFSYRAMVPIESLPAGKTSLTDTVKLGQTPAGKSMKFEHRGSYEDIDSTYEAITAFLDEKGLEAQNLFYEEYLNDVKTPDDPTLEVDIYVLLK